MDKIVVNAWITESGEQAIFYGSEGDSQMPAVKEACRAALNILHLSLRPLTLTVEFNKEREKDG